jgi:kynurenine formamidase
MGPSIMEYDMSKLIAKVILVLSLCATPSMAMPTISQPAIPAAENTAIIQVATSSQKSAARSACLAQYGSRFVYVSFTQTRYICHFRKSTKKLTREAARSCGKSGMKLVRINSIKIKGGKSITRFTCRR